MVIDYRGARMVNGTALTCVSLKVNHTFLGSRHVRKYYSVCPSHVARQG